MLKQIKELDAEKSEAERKSQLRSKRATIEQQKSKMRAIRSQINSLRSFKMQLAEVLTSAQQSRDRLSASNFKEQEARMKN